MKDSRPAACAPGRRLHHPQDGDPGAEEDAEDKPHGHIIAQPGGVADRQHAEHAEDAGYRGPKKQTEQVFPAASGHDHHPERDSDPRQGGMRKGVAHEGTLTQKEEGTDQPAGKAEKSRSDHDEAGVVALQQQHVEELLDVGYWLLVIGC